MKPSLSKLADIANSAHAAGERASLKGVEHFRRAGEALIAAKEQCGHGRWLLWLKENCPNIGERRAQRYMTLAKSDVTSDLIAAWKVISGNSPEEDATPREPGPFLPSEQQQRILDWLVRCRESWPEKFRAGFVPFVQHALSLMAEEDNADDGRQGSDRPNPQAGAA